MAGALGVNAVRLAEVSLRNQAGFEALLRMPGMASSGDEAEQLGLATATFEDLSLGPAVWRRVGETTALLVGATAVAAMVGSKGYASAEALWEAAAGVLVEGVFYTIGESAPIVVNGCPCGYRLGVEGPVRV